MLPENVEAKSIGEWIGGTVTPGDVASGYSRGGSPLAALVARARQYALICANLNATVAGSVPIRLYRKRANGIPVGRSRLKWLRTAVGGVGRKAAEYAGYASDVEEVTRHPAIEALRNPCEWMDGSEWLQSIYMGLGVAGNAFVWFTDGELLPLMPQYTHVIPSKTDFIAGWWYGRDTSDGQAIPAGDVLHFKNRASPRSPYYGMSPLEAAILETDLVAAATEAEWHRWRNGGRPDYMIELPPGMDDKVHRDEVRAYMRREHQGVNKTGNILVMANGAKLTPMNFAPKDMEYLAGIMQSNEVIWNAYGVPASLIKLNDANLASAKTGHRQYCTLTINPMTARVCATLTEKLLPMFGVEPGQMWFAADNAAAEDETETIEQAAKLVSIGAMTINELRSIQGLDPLPPEYGDVPRVNGVSLSRLDAPPVPMFGGAPPAPVSQTVNVPASEQPDIAAVFREAAKAFADANTRSRATEPATKQAFGLKFKHAGHVYEKAIPSIDVPGAPIKVVNEYAAKLEQWFSETMGRAAGNSFEMRGADKAELEKIIDEYTRELVRAGAVDGLSSVGRTPEGEPTLEDVIPQDALEALNKYKVRLATEITDSLAESLAGAVESGLEAGESYDEITDRVQAEIPDAARFRAERIARTEAAFAHTRGEVAAWEKVGIEGKQWLLSGNPCAMCQALAAKYPNPIPVNQPFVKLGEPLPNGSINTWEDVMGAPLHPNCTCDIASVDTLGGDS